jgi:hypothetical protein
MTYAVVQDDVHTPEVIEGYASRASSPGERVPGCGLLKSADGPAPQNDTRTLKPPPPGTTVGSTKTFCGIPVADTQ